VGISVVGRRDFFPGARDADENDDRKFQDEGSGAGTRKEDFFKPEISRFLGLKFREIK
jgi:hypothetical protein